MGGGEEGVSHAMEEKRASGKAGCKGSWLPNRTVLDRQERSWHRQRPNRSGCSGNPGVAEKHSGRVGRGEIWS